ncbi:hypothetical protein ACJJTC_016262 [Scirpophaga incertulas]
MYFPIGWPKVLTNLGGDKQIVKQIVANRDKVLFASLSDDCLAVWFCKPSVPIVYHRRNIESIQRLGVNIGVEWKPDSAMICISTSEGHLILYNVEGLSEQTAYQQYDPPTASLRRDSAELFVKEVIPSLKISLFKEVLVWDGQITRMCCISGTEILVCTTRAHLLRYRWDGVQNRDYCLDLGRIPFSINQQVSKAEPIVEDNTHVNDIEYSPLVCGFGITLNDGRAAYLTAPNLKFDPNAVQGIWAQGIDDATCVRVNHKFRLIAIGRKNSQIDVFTIDEATGGLELSHTMVLSSKDFPGDPGPVKCMRWSGDGRAVAASWERGGLSVWSTFGALLACSLAWDYGLSQDLPAHNPLTVSSLEWATEGYQLWMVKVDGEASSDLLQLDFVKSPLSVNPCMSNQRHLYLQGDDKLYVNLEDNLTRRTKIPIIDSSSDAYQSENGLNESNMEYDNSTKYREFVDDNECRKQWIVLPLPATYIATNWPLRYSAIDEAGENVCVAGRAGLAHYSRSTRRWKLFGNEAQEKDFVVTGGVLWWRDYIVIGCYSILDGKDEIRFYPREAKLDNNWLVFGSDALVTIYELTCVDNEGGVEMRCVQAVDVSALSHAACVVSASLRVYGWWCVCVQRAGWRCEGGVEMRCVQAVDVSALSHAACVVSASCECMGVVCVCAEGGVEMRCVQAVDVSALSHAACVVSASCECMGVVCVCAEGGVEMRGRGGDAVRAGGGRVGAVARGVRGSASCECMGVVCVCAEGGVEMRCVQAVDVSALSHAACVVSASCECMGVVCVCAEGGVEMRCVQAVDVSALSHAACVVSASLRVYGWCVCVCAEGGVEMRCVQAVDVSALSHAACVVSASCECMGVVCVCAEGGVEMRCVQAVDVSALSHAACVVRRPASVWGWCVCVQRAGWRCEGGVEMRCVQAVDVSALSHAACVVSASCECMGVVCVCAEGGVEMRCVQAVDVSALSHAACGCRRRCECMGVCVCVCRGGVEMRGRGGDAVRAGGGRVGAVARGVRGVGVLRVYWVVCVCAEGGVEMRCVQAVDVSALSHAGVAEGGVEMRCVQAVDVSALSHAACVVSASCECMGGCVCVQRAGWRCGACRRWTCRRCRTRRAGVGVAASVWVVCVCVCAEGGVEMRCVQAVDVSALSHAGVRVSASLRVYGWVCVCVCRGRGGDAVRAGGGRVGAVARGVRGVGVLRVYGWVCVCAEGGVEMRCVQAVDVSALSHAGVRVSASLRVYGWCVWCVCRGREGGVEMRCVQAVDVSALSHAACVVSASLRVYGWCVCVCAEGGVEMRCVQAVDVSALSHAACVVSASLCRLQAPRPRHPHQPHQQAPPRAPDSLVLNASGKLMMVQREEYDVDEDNNPVSRSALTYQQTFIDIRHIYHVIIKYYVLNCFLV